MEPPNNNQTYLLAFVENLAVERERDRREREGESSHFIVEPPNNNQTYLLACVES